LPGQLADSDIAFSDPVMYGVKLTRLVSSMPYMEVFESLKAMLRVSKLPWQCTELHFWSDLLNLCSLLTWLSWSTPSSWIDDFYAE
jgi:hypothetical protein